MGSDETHKISQEERQTHFSAEDAYFRQLEKQRLEAIKSRAKQRRMVCQAEDTPPDGCPLVHTTYKGVAVDHCERCKGIWLDEHELEEILRNVEKENAKPPGFLQMLVDSLKPTA